MVTAHVHDWYVETVSQGMVPRILCRDCGAEKQRARTSHWCLCSPPGDGAWCRNRVVNCDPETCTERCTACEADDHSGHYGARP